MTSLIQLTPRRAPNDGSGDQSGQYVPADITPGQNTPAIPESIQKRFDELTANQREAERRYQDAMALNQQLLARVAAPPPPVAQQGPSAPVITLPEGTDPALAQAFKAQQDYFAQALAQQAKSFEQTVQTSMGGVRMTQEQMRVQQAAQGEDPAVAQLAQKLYQDWTQKGHTGWNPEDAITHAKGMLAAQGKWTPPAQGQGNIRHINQPAMNFGAAPPAPNAQTMLPERLDDAILNKMTPEKRLAYEADRMVKTGGIDQAIIM